MSSFQSAPLPLVTRLFANPILHITVISFLVVAGTLYIIRQQQKQEIARRMEYLRGGPVFADVRQKSPSGSQDSSSATASNESIASDLAPPPPPAAETPAAHSRQGFLPSNRNMATVNEPQDRGNRAATGERTANAREVKMKVHYVLAPRAAVARLVQEAQNQPSFVDFGDVKMGTVRNATSALSGMDPLESLEKTAEIEGAEVLWHVGEKGENGIGITSKLSLINRDNQGIHGEIEILKVFHESSERGNPPTLKPFGPAQFEIAPKTSLILTMLLPTVPQSETATGFMRLFQMTNFLNRQSEFVMIIDFE